MFSKLNEYFFKPVSNAPLIIFRIIFGFLITAEAWGAIATGWVKEVFIDSTYTFPFIDFEWLKPLPGNGMYYYYVVMGTFGFMVMVGWYYRIAIISYTLLWSATYFMQKISYNNHYYLLILLCLIMCMLPANKKLSLDVRKKRTAQSEVCPNWCLLIFVIQIAIVYTYAGIAKINPDWLSGQTIKIMMLSKADYPIIGDLLQENWVQIGITYGGLLFDLFITPFLFWNRSRRIAFAVLVFFHLFNSIVFQIGIFPFMGIALSIFFFPPEEINKLLFRSGRTEPEAVHYPASPLIVFMIVAWTMTQLLLPLRHWWYEGDVNWTEEGHRLSWRMMLRLKSGKVSFLVKDKDTGNIDRISITDYVSYNRRNSIATKPDFCWQFIQLVKKDYYAKGKKNIEIYAESWASLNKGLRKPMYKPDYNLAEAKWERFKNNEWVNWE